MNYFAHGREFIDEPFVLAGTATPDWLSVVNRRARARERLATPFVDDADPQTAAVARGIVRHHRDDNWFHQTRPFAELNLGFTRSIRDLLAPDDGFRPSFLGHILVEILLDAVLIERDPARLDDYYRAIESLDPHAVAREVNRMVTQPTGLLAEFIVRFAGERFLCDYADDGKLLIRLNHIMRRVKLPRLPERMQEFLPEAREAVRRRADELLTRPDSATAKQVAAD